MNYAIIALSGRQYKVSAGQIITIDRLPGKKNFEIKEVLLTNIDGQIKIGTPYVDAKVSFETIGNLRGPKIRVSKFKAKSRYRKTIGFRADLTKIKVLKISEV